MPPPTELIIISPSVPPVIVVFSPAKSVTVFVVPYIPKVAEVLPETYELNAGTTP